MSPPNSMCRCRSTLRSGSISQESHTVDPLEVDLGCHHTTTTTNAPRVIWLYNNPKREREREMRGEHPSFRVTHVHGLYVNFYLSDEYRKERMCPAERRRSETDWEPKENSKDIYFFLLLSFFYDPSSRRRRRRRSFWCWIEEGKYYKKLLVMVSARI